MKFGIAVTGALCAGAVFSYLICALTVAEPAETGKSAAMTVTKTKQSGKIREVTKISLVKGKDAHKIVIEKIEQPRPMATMGDWESVDEAELTGAQKAVLNELQEALDKDDLKAVRKALRKFAAKASEGGLEGRVPVCLRAKAVETLGWFGKAAAVDLIGFVADSNEDVANDAFSAFESSLNDCDMGDAQRSQLVVSMMKALSDGEQIDSLLSQLNDMRNSVKADTASEILASGSEKAKAMMQENLAEYFDGDVTSADDIQRWKAMNPDDEGDAELYGAQK